MPDLTLLADPDVTATVKTEKPSLRLSAAAFPFLSLHNNRSAAQFTQRVALPVIDGSRQADEMVKPEMKVVLLSD
jgi:hypothetical protein